MVTGEGGMRPVGRAWRRFFDERAVAGNPHHVRVGYSSATNARAMKELVRRLMGAPGGRLVLDAGCGDGVLASGLVGADRVVGVDFTPGMLALARGQGLLPVRADIGALPFADGSFDLVACVETVTVTDDPLATVAELARVVAPGGRLIVTALNRRSPLRRAVRGVLARLGHLQPALLEADAVARTLADAGLTVEETVWVALDAAWREPAAGRRGALSRLRERVAPNFAIVARRPAA